MEANGCSREKIKVKGGQQNGSSLTGQWTGRETFSTLILIVSISMTTFQCWCPMKAPTLWVCSPHTNVFWQRCAAPVCQWLRCFQLWKSIGPFSWDLCQYFRWVIDTTRLLQSHWKTVEKVCMVVAFVFKMTGSYLCAFVFWAFVTFTKESFLWMTALTSSFSVPASLQHLHTNREKWFMLPWLQRTRLHTLFHTFDIPEIVALSEPGGEDLIFACCFSSPVHSEI